MRSDGDSVSTDVRTAPRADEAYVALFGPGYGESVLAHLGHGDWLIVDSCMPLGATEPLPLEHLRAIGVEPASAVKLIIASHWHDDHVREFARVVRACRSAKFACSTALLGEEFVALVHALRGGPPSASDSGVGEFGRFLRELEARPSLRSVAGTGVQYALANRMLWHRQELLPCRVWSLSPSDAEHELALRDIAKMMPTGAQRGTRQRRRLPPVRPNNTAVAVWLEIGAVSVLLGADLEEMRPSGNVVQDCGWSAIVGANAMSPARASLTKVPHHGSETAYCRGVWEKLLEGEPTALLTPFRRGGVSLPTESGAAKIRAHTPHAYLSSVHPRKKAKPRNKVVARAYREVCKEIWDVPLPGSLIARADASAGAEPRWSVELGDRGGPL